jgi:hypothetical protein
MLQAGVLANRMLSQWIQTITGGGTPNFGANLTY